MVVVMMLIIIFLLGVIVLLKVENKTLQDLADEANQESTRIKGILGMVSYYVREYQEGKNPYTTFRDIINVLRKEL